MIILTNFIKIFNLFKVNKNKLFPFFNMSKIWPKNWIMWQKHGSHWQIIILIIMITMIIRKWFEPRSNIPWLKKIIWVIRVLRRTVVGDWLFDNLCGSHLQSQVILLVSWKFKNSGERFDWSIDRVAVDKRVIWLAVETCVELCK